MKQTRRGRQRGCFSLSHTIASTGEPMRLRGLIAVAALSIFSTIKPLNADAPQTICACANIASGRIRVVQANEACKTEETLLVWNVAGPTGPEGRGGVEGPA